MPVASRTQDLVRMNVTQSQRFQPLSHEHSHTLHNENTSGSSWKDGDEGKPNEEDDDTEGEKHKGQKHVEEE